MCVICVSLFTDFSFSQDLDIRLRNLDLIGGQDKLVEELGGRTSDIDNDMFNPNYQKVLKVLLYLLCYYIKVYLVC
jgi:hypothetical protein